MQLERLKHKKVKLQDEGQGLIHLNNSSAFQLWILSEYN